MSFTDANAMECLFSLRLEERKKLFAEYKCSISFDTLDQIVAHVATAGILLHGIDNTRQPVSEIITGNCLVMVSPPNIAFKQPQYLSYVICPAGGPWLLRRGMNYSDSAESAIAWMSSREFTENKASIIAENDTTFHEHDEKHVLHIVDGNVSDRIYLMHKRFFSGFLDWDRARPTPALFPAK